MTTYTSPCPSSQTQAAAWVFDDMYKEYHERIYRYILRFITAPQQAEDLTQDVFLRVFKSLPQMPEDLQLRAWLYRIATNVAYDALRRRRLIAWHPLEVLGMEPSNGECDDPQAEYSGPAELVRLALDQMRPSYRQALLLYEQEGYTYTQLAPIIHSAVGGVKMHLSRARQQFRALYLELQKGTLS